MPRERIRNSGSNGYADIMIRWSKLGSAEQAMPIQGAEGLHVDLFVAPKDLPGYSGGFYWHPDNPEQFNLKEGESVGPISIDLDRVQINRLIRVLRTARDTAYGSDE